jgi:hypothetical protein
VTVTETGREERRTDVELGPLFTAGAVLLALGLIRRRKTAIAAGLATIWADQRTQLGRDLKARFRPPSTS